MVSLSTYVADNINRVISMPIEDYIAKYRSVAVEPKIDGTRVFLIVSNEKSVLVTKHNGIYTKSDYPELFKEIEMLRIPKQTIIDCELVKKFQRLHAFDIVHLGGSAVKSSSYTTRKKLLSEFGSHDFFMQVPYTFVSSSAEAEQLYQQYISEGYEGIVAKSDAPYGAVPWVKKKKFDTVDAFVIAFKPTEITKETGIYLSYEIGVYDEKGNIVSLGDVSSATAEVDRSQIKLGTVLEVRYQPTEGFDKLRHPTIIRIRDDKVKEECRI